MSIVVYYIVVKILSPGNSAGMKNATRVSVCLSSIFQSRRGFGLPSIVV
jgi:hypothetical protein